jgi:hypothetical protein
MGLADYTPATFNAAAKTAFASGLATVLGVHPADVTVVNVTAYTTSGRRLLDAGVEVGVEILAADNTTAASLSTSLTAAGSNPAALVSALRAAGLTAVTSVAVTASPSVTTVVDESVTATSAAARRADYGVLLLAAALLAACAAA